MNSLKSVDLVVENLKDRQKLKDSRIHPISLLLARSTYERGAGFRGRLNWQCNKTIVDALEFAFYEAFHNVQPTNKRYCLAVDVSGSMGFRIQNSCLTCSEAAAALSMAIIRTEPHVTSVAFSDELVPLDWRKDMNLSEVVQNAKEITMGATDCALPMLWAERNEKLFDVHPFQALQQYRKRLGIPDAKLIVMGMVCTDFSIADPSDPNMLDICGFDSSVPQLLVCIAAQICCMNGKPFDVWKAKDFK
ncbi:unnamed protein product [Gongylonema pulchrum]|uniref:TROVE domain-containing protein n=1 Tax=Gongylonema pulchrum TaxID=637853 RepID=A0A183E2B9_9BILA|nr:unnamed protein product [Gongylonema pulchrum]